MKCLVVAVLALVALAQADLTTLKPKNLYVNPQQPAPYNPKIVGGEEASVGQFPYQCALDIDNMFFCGCSILSANKILTAAHCADGAKSIIVTAGAHNIRENEPNQQKVAASKIVVHEEWDANNIRNDVAVLHLESDLDLNASVQTINLRAPGCPDTSLDGQQATVSGWGRPSDSSGSISPVLRHVSNPLLTNSACKSWFNIIQDSNICLSGASGKGSCNGDSGGPLVVNGDNGVEEVGIVSFGSGWGCEWGFPTAYARVSCFRDWIDSH